MPKKQRVPRKLKKAIKNAVISVDIKSFPEGLCQDIQEWFEVYNQTGIIFYDSEHGGQAPQFLPMKGNKKIKAIKVK